ncbi:MAG: DUF1446 domain-containing protein [Proteobacteria bacterium]|nr:DUF1446 domain-containing protein [Pseudomonadota bacterium]MBU4580820.1 DUF1446 domain-containing protein [Pseudomonadota bacterium]
MRDDHFDVEPLDMDARCTPQSVASHTLYENADPFLITEPDGTIDSTGSRYEALSDRAVRVYGSQFRKADRITIKLEGAELDGYQSVIVAGGREGHSGENVTYRERKENHHENLRSRSICSVRR